MNSVFEVLNPWADVDPIPLEGLSPRLGDLTGKTIGFLNNRKKAAVPIETVIENRLKETFPGVKTTWYSMPRSMCDMGGHPGDQGFPGEEAKTEFAEWVKGVDAVIAALGD
jgi:hypothetical protein